MYREYITSHHLRPFNKNILEELLQGLLKGLLLFLFLSGNLNYYLEVALEFLTQSVSVFPRRLIDEGFGFDFPEIESAMSDLI